MENTSGTTTRDLFEESILTNRVAIELNFVDGIIHLLEGTLDRPYEQFLSLSSLIESAVLNEGIFLKDCDSFVADHKSDRSSRADQIVSILQGVFDNKESKSSAFLLESERNGRIRNDYLKMVGKKRLSDDPGFENYIAKLPMRKYWDVLDEVCWDHGIPVIDSPEYSKRIDSKNKITNPARDLYNKIEGWKKEYFEKLERYLGKRVFPMPSLTSIVLSRCSEFHKFPSVMMELRDEYSEFRKKCTHLENGLKYAVKLKDQFQIIDEIESSYVKISQKKSNGKAKNRAIFTVFDIAKNVDPIKMGLSAVGKMIDHDIEKQALLRIPGYYDLWNASLDVESSYYLAKKHFGEKFAETLSKEFKKRK